MRRLAKQTSWFATCWLFAIVEGKENAFRCEGSCNMWLHHYCGGVSASHFKDLAGSSTPSSACLYCSQKAQQDTIGKLQSEYFFLPSEYKPPLSHLMWVPLSCYILSLNHYIFAGNFCECGKCSLDGSGSGSSQGTPDFSGCFYLHIALRLADQVVVRWTMMGGA